jgi:hypothetical protein
MTKRQESEVLTQSLWPDTAREAGLGRNAVYEAARRGEIPTIRFGRKLRVPIERWRRLLAGDGPKAA